MLFPELDLSLDALRGRQLTRLQESLQHAYANQAPYRAKCEAAGVHPDGLHQLDDLERFPFTVKSDLRDAYPFGMFAIPREKCVRVHASSGTTGRPTVVGYSAKDIDTWAGLMARSLHAGGARPGDVLHNAYGYGLFTGGLGFHYGAERLGCTVVPMSGGFSERQVQLIREFGARVVLMTPSYMMAIADEFDRQGIDPRSTALRVGFFGAEPWTEGMRAEIERRLGIDAIDVYGLSEVMANPANWSSPRSPRRRCRSSAIARATSRACCRVRPAGCGAWPRSPAAVTTC
jgi:phenylacetate-CoA ligase